jgi:glutamate formiminotransferase / 5-formyltetrahydrofolate cyclo-ligase
LPCKASEIVSELPLLAVPNVSEGRRQSAIAEIADAFTAGGGVRLLDVHSDVDHHRSVFTLAGAPGELSCALLDGTTAAVERIDVGDGRAPSDIGEHPHVGAVDVMPLVYLSEESRGVACVEALVVAQKIGEQLGVPVFLYGELSRGRTRAELRRGGVGGLANRIGTGELHPDFGPSRLHPTAGATLVAAREPLVAFNLELTAPASVQDASRIASLIREGGAEGLLGVRAIGVSLRARPHREARGGEVLTAGDRDGTPIAQVSMNIERPLEVPLRVVVEAVRNHTEVAAAELVGLAPRAALEGFPDEVPLRAFDAGVHVIENALGF